MAHTFLFLSCQTVNCETCAQAQILEMVLVITSHVPITNANQLVTPIKLQITVQKGEAILKLFGFLLLPVDSLLLSVFFPELEFNRYGPR
jgi:hypothetical protein